MNVMQRQRRGAEQLVCLVAHTGVGPEQRLDIACDAQRRRIQKLVSTNNGSVYVPQSTNRFVYDGWNLVAILNPQSSLLQSFLWGLDLSGTLQGSGGVGGLLAVNSAANGVHFCAYDGNGNVAALVKGSDGTVTASYEYGPFGENVRVTGAMGKVNPFRFSTKYQDDESDFLYYGYRSYNPSAGRWLNRDPIEEGGGLNLYGFANNNAVSFVDDLGQAPMGWPVVPPPGYPPTFPPTFPQRTPQPPRQDFETGSKGRTEAVKNRSTVRADVATLIYNMLASRDKSCTRGKTTERKRFNPASTTSYAFMYFTGYFLLGQVSVPLDGKGYYEVDCCTKTFGKWEIVVHGSFRDKFDELIPVPGPKKGVGSLPLTFVGEWVEFYSGSE